MVLAVSHCGGVFYFFVLILVLLVAFVVCTPLSPVLARVCQPLLRCCGVDSIVYDTGGLSMKE
jgi:hypothetical protein